MKPRLSDKTDLQLFVQDSDLVARDVDRGLEGGLLVLQHGPHPVLVHHLDGTVQYSVAIVQVSTSILVPSVEERTDRPDVSWYWNTTNQTPIKPLLTWKYILPDLGL